MLPHSNLRSRYLSLALDTRRVIDVLVLFVKETDISNKPDASNMEALLSQVVDSLPSNQDRERLFSIADTRSLFGDFERVEMFEEVKSSFPLHDIRKELELVLRGDADVAARKKNAETAIQFFCALEGRALERYAQAMHM